MKKKNCFVTSHNTISTFTGYLEYRPYLSAMQQGDVTDANNYQLITNLLKFIKELETLIYEIMCRESKYTLRSANFASLLITLYSNCLLNKTKIQGKVFTSQSK